MKLLALSINDKNWKDFYNMAFGYILAYFASRQISKEVDVCEKKYTDAHSLEKIISGVVKAQPDILAISVYIWNKNLLQKVLPAIKQALPKLRVIAGGPELQWEFLDEFAKYDYLDFVVIGEGEIVFSQLVQHIKNPEKFSLENIPNIIYKDKTGEVKYNKAPQTFPDVNQLPSPYFSKVISKKILKYTRAAIQTQRGCPLSCGFCYENKMSNKVRYFDLDRVYKEIDIVVESVVKGIYFLDSTFNSNKKRAKQILRYLAKKRKHHKFNVTVSMVPEFFDQEMVLLCKIAGISRIEIGVQSLNETAIDIMQRFRNKQKLLEVIDMCIKAGLNVIPQIIAGLPGENLNTFFQGFNRLYSLAVTNVEIFGLRLLPGTLYREQAGTFGIKYNPDTYKIIESNDFSQQDLQKFRQLSQPLYNLETPAIKPQINTALEQIAISPSDFFFGFMEFCKKNYKRNQVYANYLPPILKGSNNLIINKLLQDYIDTFNRPEAFKPLKKCLQNIAEQYGCYLPEKTQRLETSNLPF